MFIYSIRRLASALPLLFFAATLVFFLMRLAPGGPFDGEREWPPEIKANVLSAFELDKPVTTQYLHWLRDVLKGDLRKSFQYPERTVTEIIGNAMPTSLYLGFLALSFAVIIGVPLGAAAAWKQNSWWDHSAMFVAISGVSVPPYLIASLLVMIFAMWLGWLPPALWDEPGSSILPAITLGWRPMAMVARLTRATMLEAFHADYVRTAYSKGVPDIIVIFKHALRNSLVPVLTLLGPVTAHLVTGSFLVELVFEIPGMGKHFVQAVTNRDYTLVMGVTILYGSILIVSNLVVDLLCAWVDPRIRLEG